MPKRKKGNTTQPPPPKRQSTCSTAATSHLNRNTIASLQPTRGIAATPESQSMPTTQTTVNTSKTPADNTSVVATQQQSLQTLQLIS